MDRMEALEKLSPLLGVWKGRGRGSYPTIDGFDYVETLQIRRDSDAPYLTYEQSTELIGEDGNPIRKSHWEAGVLRPLDDGSFELAYVQSSGRVEVLRGELIADESLSGKLSLRFHNELIGNDSRVRSTSREWHVPGSRFQYVMSMAAISVDEPALHVEASLYKL
jgi:hypothetical protein